MGQKKDIGTLFENKLNDGKKTPNNSLWEKINTSLDEEKRRKKRVIYYWLVGGGLSILLGLVLLFGNGFFLKTESVTPKENITLIESSNTNSKKESNETHSKISKEDSLTNKNYSEEKLSKIDTPTKNLKQSEAVNSSENNKSETKSKKISSNKKPVDETFTVSEKYYYYNSRNGKQLVTESKKEIDILISKHYKSLDTIVTKKSDSLEQ